MDINNKKKVKIEPEPEYVNDENQVRGNWAGKFDFILSLVGYAVGLGNIWRFPYKAYDNGGATFLIPYVIMLAIAGLPLFFLEMAIGQFCSKGPISIFEAVPIFKGLGYGMVMISALVCIYYNMIIAYSIFYFFASFGSNVPWAECKQEWIEKYNCNKRDFKENASYIRKIIDEMCKEMKLNNNTNTNEYRLNCTPQSPAQIYWEREVLDMSEGIDDGLSEYKWKLVLCLLGAWIIVFVCLIKGIKSSGKVVYFTAIFPFVVIFILLIRGALLEGSLEGIKFYVIPKWEKLKDAKPWYEAAAQIFYSLGIAFGSLQTMSSYNNFKNNIYRNAIIVAVINCSTSVIAGFAVFSLLGHMSYRSGLPIEEVATSGPGLVFVVYPEGIAMMPVSPLWSILFFFMLFSLGIDSQFGTIEPVITAIIDEFEKMRRFKLPLTAFLCVTFFLLGLPQCSRAGIYIMNLFDTYSASYSIMIIALLEVTAISWIYGFNRFEKDIQCMIGFKLNYFWRLVWVIVTPAAIVFIIVFSSINYVNIVYGSYDYPDWADGIGWLMVGLGLIFIPILAIIELHKAYKKSYNFKMAFKCAFKPTENWGPYKDEFKEERKLLDNNNMGIDNHSFEYPISTIYPSIIETNGKI